MPSRNPLEAKYQPFYFRASKPTHPLIDFLRETYIRNQISKKIRMRESTFPQTDLLLKVCICNSEKADVLTQSILRDEDQGKRAQSDGKHDNVG